MILAPDRQLVLPERCARCGGWKPTTRQRLAPFWRGGVRALNTAGKSQRNSNGKRQRNANGKHVRNTATTTICCCASPCPGCDATLRSATLTFVGTTNNDGTFELPYITTSAIECYFLQEINRPVFPTLVRPYAEWFYDTHQIRIIGTGWLSFSGSDTGICTGTTFTLPDIGGDSGTASITFNT